MVCNTESSIYQVPIVGTTGACEGLFRLSKAASEMGVKDQFCRRIWRGLPWPVTESKLVLIEGYSGKRTYGVLIEDPNGHWVRRLSDERAASWFFHHECDLPNRLRHVAPTSIDLQDRERLSHHPVRLLPGECRKVWNCLRCRAMTANRIANELDANYLSEDAVRKTIERINDCQGFDILNKRGVGYYRPDAPPPEMIRATP